MKELNPIIRNAVFTAHYALVRNGDSPAARRFADYHMQMIPPYWEELELLAGFKDMLDREKSALPFSPSAFGLDLP